LVFSFRPILVKLVYVTYPVSPVTLLFLRMSISLPFFLIVAWWLRGGEPRLSALDWAKVAALACIGYYAASFLDSIGLPYVGAGGELVKRIGSMRFTAYSMAVATLPAVVQFFLIEPLSALDLPGKVWLYAILLATFTTVLPLFIQAEALKRIGAPEFALIGALG